MPIIFDKKYLLRCLIELAVMAGLMRISDGAAFALIIPLILVAAVKRNPERMLFLLVVSVSMLLGNSNIMCKGVVFGYVQRLSMMLVSALMLVQIFGRRSSYVVTPMLGILPYIIWMFLVSGSGWCPFVSYLKLILFAAVFFACYGVANDVAVDPHILVVRVRSVFLSLACFFILGSVALVPFPSVAQMGQEEMVAALLAGEDVTSLFMGMTFHSQALGPVCAILGTALFADLVFGVRKFHLLYVLLILCVPALIWKTSSRTAMGAFAVGVMTCALAVLSARVLEAKWRRKIVNTLIFISFVGFVALVSVPAARDRVAGFVLKYDRSHTAKLTQLNSEDVLKTRQAKWDEGIRNFKQSPIVGNGFQVSEDMRNLRVDFSTLSAPVEKSIWISAVLEEGGLIGFLFFSAFLLCAFIKLKRRRAYVGLSVLLVFMVINLGEFTVFSMSGFGGFAWVLVFTGLILDAARLREEYGRMYGR